MWNRLEYRPLEGFVFAVSPFNFTAIGANLPASAALMGNTVVWKPAGTASYSAHFLMGLLQEAGLPPGVINLVYGSGRDDRRRRPGEPATSPACTSPARPASSTRCGTRSASNVGSYRNYPRIVGETGGKDFIVAHPSADVDAVATAIVRGSFEYQGQKCSAASRVYAPPTSGPSCASGSPSRWRRSRWATSPTSRTSWARSSTRSRSRRRGRRSRRPAPTSRPRSWSAAESTTSEGFFVEPTVIETKDPDFRLLRDELFGPVVTAYVYREGEWGDTLELVDRTAPYGLTGAVFADDRDAVLEAKDALRYAAGNFYVNDKPTGAVVGQQPFGGARASGTNDKAGSMWNLIRWVSPRTIKETFVPPTDYRYPFMAPDGDGSGGTREARRLARGSRGRARPRRLLRCGAHRGHRPRGPPPRHRQS